jgi:hypothetical protein
MQENNVLIIPNQSWFSVTFQRIHRKRNWHSRQKQSRLGFPCVTLQGDSLRPHCACPQTSNRLIISTCATNSPPNYVPHRAHKAVRPTLGRTWYAQWTPILSIVCGWLNASYQSQLGSMKHKEIADAVICLRITRIKITWHVHNPAGLSSAWSSSVGSSALSASVRLRDSSHCTRFDSKNSTFCPKCSSMT